ncbi:unnamed protein product [Arabidopsis lyrata]|nr:unnamed protein product [Arabidopsis lyrata]
MDLSESTNLKKLPDLSTASNLILLYLNECTSLVELPSSIGNAINLKSLYLTGCSGLVKLPSSIGNATNLQNLYCHNCSSLVELPFSIGNATNLRCLYLVNCSSMVELPSSIGNLHQLVELNLKGCSKLEVLPTKINLESLYILDLTDCLMFKSFPEISTNIKVLKLMGTAIKEVPLSIKLWSRLCDLEMSYNENLKELPHALGIITTLYIKNTEMREIPLWVKKSSCLRELKLIGCKKLVSLPQLSDSLLYLEVENCESLERLDCSFNNPKISLKFFNCIKLNKEARDLIIKTSTNYAVLPSREVPANFTYRANTRSFMTISFNQRALSTTSRFKACIFLVYRGDKEEEANVREITISYRIEEKHSLDVFVPYRHAKYYTASSTLTKHLFIFEFEADVTSNELFFHFKTGCEEVLIEDYGVLQL